MVMYRIFTSKTATFFVTAASIFVIQNISVYAASTDNSQFVRNQIAPMAVPAPAPGILIDFSRDAAGSKPNGFSSVVSSEVTFSDTKGNSLIIQDFGHQSHGQALAVYPDDDSGLRITLARPTTGITIAFGNDDPCCSDPGDEAVLTVYRGTTQVGQSRVTLNRNDNMDQTITFGQGPLFNRIVFQYDVDPARGGLIEVVDDILIAPLCTIAGTDGRDVLNGTNSRDIICGGPGDDVINANGGNDLVYGGPGRDRISGGPGNDELHGNLDNDIVSGDDGDDFVGGEDGNDTLTGGTGTDICKGGTGTDTGGSGCESRVGIP